LVPRPQQQQLVQTICAPKRPVALAGMASLQWDSDRQSARHNSRHSRCSTGGGDVAQPGYASGDTSSNHTTMEELCGAATGSRSPGSRSRGSRSPEDSASRSPVGSRHPSTRGASPGVAARITACLMSSHRAVPATTSGRAGSISGCSQSMRATPRSSISTAFPQSAHASPVETRSGSKESFGRTSVRWSSSDTQPEGSGMGPKSSQETRVAEQRAWTWTDASTILNTLDAEDTKSEQDQGCIGCLPRKKTAQEIDAEFGDICANLSEHVAPPAALQVAGDELEDWKAMSKETAKPKKTFADQVCEQQGIIPVGCSSAGGSPSSTVQQASQAGQGQTSDSIASTLARVRAKVKAVTAVNLMTGDLRRDMEIESQWQTAMAAKRLREGCRDTSTLLE